VTGVTRERIGNKMRRGYELHQKAEELRQRAEAARNCSTIFSDDPQAEEKIEAKNRAPGARQA